MKRSIGTLIFVFLPFLLTAGDVSLGVKVGGNIYKTYGKDYEVEKQADQTYAENCFLSPPIVDEKFDTNVYLNSFCTVAFTDFLALQIEFALAYMFPNYTFTYQYATDPEYEQVKTTYYFYFLELPVLLKGCWALDSKKKILLNIFTGPDLFFHFYDISKQRINVVSVNNIDYAPGYIKKGAIALVFGFTLSGRLVLVYLTRYPL